jgi:hypothetical protein
MTFPATPLGMTVELFINGAWTDVTSLVYGRDQLAVTRGRSSEGTEVERSTCKFTADNRSGNLSPRNPTGSYYLLIGRNTPCRVKLTPASDSYLLLAAGLADSTTGLADGAVAPDTAGLSITGDIDIRIDIQPDTTTGRQQGLANKWLAVGNQRSWALWLDSAGLLNFRWSADGSTSITKTSTVAVAFPASGRLAVRVVLDVNNGAAGNDTKFYTAPDIAGTWTQLGATVTTAATTAIFDSTANLQIGGSKLNGGTDDLLGRLYAFQMYQGIAGTVKADVDLDAYEAGAASFTDPQANVWTLIGDASIVDLAVRFHGEISEWPQRWDTSGRDVYVPIEASGILRRLTQGVAPLKSTLYRGYTSLANQPKAYWPCEDGEDATVLASAIGGLPMKVTGTPTLASSTVFKCSQPLPIMNSSQWEGSVPGHAGTGNIQVWILISIPAAGTTNGQSLFSVFTTGTVKKWSVGYATGGSLILHGYDSDGSEVANSGNIAFNLDGNPERISLSLEQNGANIDWEILGQRLDGGVGGLGGTFNSLTVSRATGIVVNPGADDLGDIAFGHVSIHDEVRDAHDLADEFIAYNGETAGRRIQRLCGEEGVAFRPVGNPDNTAALGSQLPKTLIELLRDAADVDGGILYEPRDLFGLAYRTREDLYRQAVGLDLDYAAAHLSGIEPVDDDQATRNDITVQREEGASFRIVEETGPLSILAPPDGVGRYDEQVTLSLSTDEQLPDAAGWLLHLGTVDEARYPVLSVDLARAPFVASQALALAAQDLDVGDRLTVANPPGWLPPDDITQLAQGFAETMGNFTHRIDVNCSPESPWGQAAVYDDGVSRYSSDGSTLNSGITSTATSLSIATSSGPLWTHVDGDFDIRIGGELMTVTAVSGASSPQTFTVTRSVNGVVKAHSSGETVELSQPRVYVP